jgi:hypothetical protein
MGGTPMLPAVGWERLQLNYSAIHAGSVGGPAPGALFNRHAELLNADFF